jgi:peptidoglycan/xylan/chitin deacetylase (PgdA/CDA1 family)
MFIFALIGLAVTALAHMVPTQFVLEAMAGERGVWHMSRGAPPTVYLTYDDGPNPKTTPDLLDVLRREDAHATFFLIDAHVTEETAPIIRRIFDDGHAIGLHSVTRGVMLLSPAELAETFPAAADRIEKFGGARPCRAFRPHAGWRGGQMYEGLRKIDYKLIGWGWMLWDWNWFRPRNAQSSFERIAGRVSAGDVVVLHDGDESAPRRDQRHTVEATALLIPTLRARGFTFARICP